MPTKNPFVGFEKDQRRTYSLWERFNAGDLDAGGPVDPYVKLMINEWRRCAKFGVDPTRKLGEFCSAEAFQQHLLDNRQLLAAARPVIDKLTTDLSDVPGIVLLADPDGVILYVAGNAYVRNLAAERNGVTEGTCWLESVAGTNGLGSALSKLQPVHVYSSEHFCEGWHHWTCAGTPLLDPDSGEPVGVVDFTTIEKDYQEKALALTWSMAEKISRDLQRQNQPGRDYLLQRYEGLRARYRSESLILLDDKGHLLRTDRDKSEKLPVTARFLEQFADRIPIHMEGTRQYLGSAYVLNREVRTEGGIIVRSGREFRSATASRSAATAPQGAAVEPAPLPGYEPAVPPAAAARSYEKLPEDEGDYQVIFDNAIVGICYCVDRLIVRCNRRFEQMLGYEPGQLDNARLREVLPTELDYRRLQRAISRHFRTHRVYSDERLLQRRSGELFWCAVSIKQLGPATRSRSVWILQDISRRKTAEDALQRTHQRLESLVQERTRKVRETNAALREQIARRKRIEQKLGESRKKYRTLFQTSPVGMFITDSAGNVVEVNRAMARMIPKSQLMLSMRQSKAVQITQIQADGSPMKREDFADVRALREGRAIPEFELGVRDRDNQVRWFCVSGAPIPVAGFGAVVVHREITETKRLEEQERAQRMELARASRVNTMGEMAAAMAHELGQPLSSAVNFLSGCQLRLADGEYDQRQVQSAISEALHYAEQAGDIIKHIRQFVRLHEPNTVSCDVHQIIRDMVRFMDAERRLHDATIHLALTPGLPQLLLDPFEIRQLMLNLIKNGLEAMAAIPVEQRVLSITTRLKGRKWVEVCVSDRGKGVSAEDIPNIFKPFYSTKESGMGLGLVICRSIVESHGGKLCVSNCQHGGASFAFSLPHTEARP